MRYGSHVQSQIEGLRRTDVHGDSGFYFRIETCSADFDLVVPGEQIHSDIESVNISIYYSTYTRSNVLDNNLCLRDYSPGRIGDGSGKSSSSDLCTQCSRNEDYGHQEKCRFTSKRRPCRESLRGHRLTS